MVDDIATFTTQPHLCDQGHERVLLGFPGTDVFLLISQHCSAVDTAYGDGGFAGELPFRVWVWVQRESQQQ